MARTLLASMLAASLALAAGCARDEAAAVQPPASGEAAAADPPRQAALPEGAGTALAVVAVVVLAGLLLYAIAEIAAADHALGSGGRL